MLTGPDEFVKRCTRGRIVAGILLPFRCCRIKTTFSVRLYQRLQQVKAPVEHMDLCRRLAVAAGRGA